MTTIADFLLSRIAEDEAAANAASTSTPYVVYGPADPIGKDWTSNGGMVNGDGWDLWDCEGSDTLCMPEAAASHIARHDPARVLAECAAKRAIVAENPGLVRLVEGLSAAIPGNLNQDPDAPWRTIYLRHLAAVYVDHPDYRQEWVA